MSKTDNHITGPGQAMLARITVDLASSETIVVPHIAKALQYRARRDVGQIVP